MRKPCYGSCLLYPSITDFFHALPVTPSSLLFTFQHQISPWFEIAFPVVNIEIDLILIERVNVLSVCYCCRNCSSDRIRTHVYQYHHLCIISEPTRQAEISYAVFCL